MLVWHDSGAGCVLRLTPHCYIRKKSPHYIDIYRQIDILDSLDKSPVSSPVPCLLRATEPGPCLVRANERNQGAMGAY
jgi:hypothetical protein